MEDHYERLNVARSASTETIAESYRRSVAAVQADEDLSPDEVTRKLASLQVAANDLLRNKTRRRYDASLAAAEAAGEEGSFDKPLRVGVNVGIDLFLIEAHAAYAGDEVRVWWDVRGASRLELTGMRGLERALAKPGVPTLSTGYLDAFRGEWHQVSLRAYDGAGALLDERRVTIYNLAFAKHEVYPQGADPEDGSKRGLYASVQSLLVLAQLAVGYHVYEELGRRLGSVPPLWSLVVLFATGGAMLLVVAQRLDQLNRPKGASLVMALPILNLWMAYRVAKLRHLPPPTSDRTRAIAIGNAIWNSSHSAS